MSIEAGKLSEAEKKKKKLSEKESKENKKKNLEHKKVKEKISVEIDTDDSLWNLKELISKWVISKETAEKIISGSSIDEKNIKEIFEKIDQIEEVKNIDKYLPKKLRITKEDYSQSLHNDIFRTKTITKVESALIILWEQVNPDNAIWINLFSWFLTILDKNLILIQEYHIDIKNNLKEIDKQNKPKEKQISWWKKFINLLKEIFID